MANLIADESGLSPAAEVSLKEAQSLDEASDKFERTSHFLNTDVLEDFFLLFFEIYAFGSVTCQ